MFYIIFKNSYKNEVSIVEIVVQNLEVIFVICTWLIISGWFADNCIDLCNID